MKDFLSKTTSIKSIFNIIFLLLLGEDEHVEIAGILLGLLKEKKNQSKSIHNLFFDNLHLIYKLKSKKVIQH